MAKRLFKRRTEPVQPAADPPAVNTNFRSEQREAYLIKLLAQELGITPAQLRSLKLAYGRDMPKIREAAARLRQR
jgi:hypothetical protein